MQNAILLLIVVMLSGCGGPESAAKSESIIYQSKHITIKTDHRLVAEELFNINVVFAKEVTEVKGKLISDTMNMGIVPLGFKPINSVNYQARSIVGACNLQEMVWLLEIKWLEQDEPRMLTTPITVYR